MSRYADGSSKTHDLLRNRRACSQARVNLACSTRAGICFNENSQVH